SQGLSNVRISAFHKCLTIFAATVFDCAPLRAARVSRQAGRASYVAGRRRLKRSGQNQRLTNETGGNTMRSPACVGPVSSIVSTTYSQELNNCMQTIERIERRGAHRLILKLPLLTLRTDPEGQRF